MKEAGLYNYIWLDLVDLCRKLTKRKSEEFKLVKYFTAVPPKPRGRIRRHKRYIEALRTKEPNIEIYPGKFYKTTEWCKNCRRRFKVLREKRTDVNIASHLVNDAANNFLDVACLITGDSDLVPSLEIVRDQGSIKKLGVRSPPKRPSGDLRRIADFNKTIPYHFIIDSQFPEEFEFEGKIIRKPEKWR